MKRTAADLLLDLSDGAISTVVDFTLWFVAFSAALSVPQSTVGQLYRARRTADRFLWKINYDVIKRGLAEARRRHWFKRGKKGKRAWPEITKAGKKRFAALFPVYDEKRIWDGDMYLITYDIPEKRRNDRDLIRDYAKRIRGAKLQESVYLTPYDPRKLIAEFIETHRIQGTIIISDIGKDGSIGDESLTELVYRVYGLDALNERYKEWLTEVKGETIDHWAALRYLSILRDDPQLPFPLLPPWWKGKEAYERVKPFLKNMVK